MSDNSQLQWNMQHWFVLLEEYAKYNKELHILLHVKRNSICNKKDLFCNDVEKDKIWKEIADVVRVKCSLNCSAIDCCEEIEKLRLQYKTYKSKAVTSSRVGLFLTHAKRAFEIEENLAVPVFEEPKYIPMQKSEWPRNKYIKLLQVYKKYESELIYPGAKNQNVWHKIAAEVREDSPEFYCGGLECCRKINSVLLEYEKIENQNISRYKADNLDKANMDLKTAENQVNFSAQKASTRKLYKCGKKNKGYRFKLLQVYAKYRTEFMRTDYDRKEVWEKIAKEMREVFSYDCGEFLCRFDLLKMQREYFQCKNSCSLSQNMPYFFNEAQEAFGTTHNLDLILIKLGNCSGESTVPYSNKRKQEEEQNSSTSCKNLTHIKLGNSSGESTVPYSNKIKQEEEQNSSTSYLTHIKLGNSSGESTVPHSNKRKQEEEQNSSTSCKKMTPETRQWYFGGEFGWEKLTHKNLILKMES